MSIDNGSRRRLVGGVTRVVLCLAIAAVIAAVAITQSSHNLHAEASVIRTWSHQKEAGPNQLGSISLSGRSYSPFHIRIDRVEVRDQLHVEEKEELFLLSIEDELILVIPKTTVSRPPYIDIRNDSGATIEIHSDSPHVLLCGAYRAACKTEISTTDEFFRVQVPELKDLAKAAGVLNQKVAATLLSFALDGKIDGQEFLVEGRVTYDNTEQSQKEFWESQNKGVWKIWMLLSLAVVVILVVPFIWFGIKKSQR